ncbi:MAG: RluA family pseudouridine synthase [Bernardetiaceae bacterium]|nr:RluA family pseudouridine synthase [Bernardetiaceae bacterium]
MRTKGFSVIYEDNHLIIVNKSPGILTQGDITGDLPIAERVKEYLKVKYEKPGNVFCGVVHRLDRPVSGVLVLAKTSKGLSRMSELFKKRKIQKTYWAITRRRPRQDEDKLVHWLVKNKENNTVQAFREPVEGAQKAELRFRVMGRINHHYLLEVMPLTGRSHQIRVQLATIGSPIRGDVKYGFPKPNEDGSICLHARRVNFIHPIKDEPVIAMAALPNTSFWEEFLTLEDFKVKDKHLPYLYG